MSGSHVPESQFEGPGCQGPRVPGSGFQSPVSQGLESQGPGFPDLRSHSPRSGLLFQPKLIIVDRWVGGKVVSGRWVGGQLAGGRWSVVLIKRWL